MKRPTASVGGDLLNLDAEQAEALRRCSSKPDLDGGDFDEERDARLYQPLVRRGFLTVRVEPIDDDYERVVYDTTPKGTYALFLFDRRAKS